MINIAVVFAVPVYTFTSAGQTGAYGPTQSLVNTAYASSNLNGAVTVNQGYQIWTVPTTGNYHIVAHGASGGTHYIDSPGLGAELQGDFYLTAGETLVIVVGQKGWSNPNSGDWGGGGGGATFLARSVSTGGSLVVPLGISVELLMAAAGGGGNHDMGDGSWGTGQPPMHGRATTSGNGGGGLYTGGETAANTGAGFSGNGLRGQGSTALSFLNGATGSSVSGYYGGFGGGGSPWNAGGGGGGYTGGDLSNPWALGGYSYNIGLNATGTDGVQLGDGNLIISLESTIPEPGTCILFAIALMLLQVYRQRR